MGDFLGAFEYIKPKQCTQYLTVNANHSCSFEEKGDNGLESYLMTGEGTWSLENNVLKVHFPRLKKEMQMKGLQMVPGIESGTAFSDNVVMLISKDELVNAPKHGTHKWRRR